MEQNPNKIQNRIRKRRIFFLDVNVNEANNLKLEAIKHLQILYE